MTVKTYDEILSSMREHYIKLSGFDPDDASDIGIRLKVLAGEVYKLYLKTAELYQQVFPQTSSGKYLELHAQARGMFRKPAVPAQGAISFRREVPSANDITVQKGAVCATRSDPQVRFCTTVTMTMPAGQTEITIPAKEIDGGSNGNVAVGAVCVMVTSVAGMSSVTNPVPFTGGVDEERDEALRERLLESFRNISNGTNTAYYYDFAMSHEGVESVNVLPRERGRGTVDVVVALGGQSANDGIISQIQTRLDKQKEINVSVKVIQAVKTLKNISLSISPKPGYGFEALSEKCRLAAQSYINRLPVGGSLYLSALTSEIMKLDGVKNCRITNPASDQAPLPTQVIKPGNITVSRIL